MEPINITPYREAAFKYLNSRINYFNSSVDELLDAALRIVSDLPLKPSGDTNYKNVLGVKPILEQRTLCLSLLEKRIFKVEDKVRDQVDELVDKSIRVLNNLPPLPDGNEFYVGLFTIEEDKKQSNNTKYFNSPKVYVTNDAAVELMHKYEGLSLKAYKDPGSKDGLPVTIG